MIGTAFDKGKEGSEAHGNIEDGGRHEEGVVYRKKRL